MSKSQNSRLAASIVALVLLISCLTLLSRGTSRSMLLQTKQDSSQPVPAEYRPLTPTTAAAMMPGQGRDRDWRIRYPSISRFPLN